MQKFVPILFFFMCLSACKQTEIFEGKPTMNQKLFLDTKAYTIDQADRIIRGGFSYLETKQIPGKKIDSAYLKPHQIDWDFYIQHFFAGNLMADSNNCYRYSMQQQENLQNITATLTYEPNYKNLKINKCIVVLNANDGDVKTVFFEYNNNTFFTETTHKITYVSGQVMQVVTISKNLFGSKKQAVQSVYFLNGNMHATDAVDIIQ
jgi:hypothetical protein